MEEYPESGVCLAQDDMALQIQDYQLVTISSVFYKLVTSLIGYLVGLILVDQLIS